MLKVDIPYQIMNISRFDSIHSSSFQLHQGKFEDTNGL